MILLITLVDALGKARMSKTPVSRHITIGELNTAFDILKAARPAYKSILSLYGPIFVAQEEARQLVQSCPVEVTEERLKYFQLQERALFDKPEFTIDRKSSRHLFKELCVIASNSDAKELNSESSFMRALMLEDFNPEPLFLAILNEDKDVFDAIALKYNSRPQPIELLSYNSIKPSLVSYASILKNFIPEDFCWQKPGCPICGSQPVLSVIDAQGNRHLVCGFCWNEWSARRIRCAFCGETDSRKLHYQFSDIEKEYRLEICNSCQSYLKTVDIRKLDRPFYPPLEHLVSTHLDMRMENSQLP
jgi:FdhE protein